MKVYRCVDRHFQHILIGAESFVPVQTNNQTWPYVLNLGHGIEGLLLKSVMLQPYQT